MTQDQELKLQAWLDGELPAAEAEAMRCLAASDPEAAQLVAELRSAKTLFGKNEVARTVPDGREFYWSKIERQIRREEPREAAPLPWVVRVRRWLAPLAGVAALVAVLLVTINQPAPAGAVDEVSTTTDGLVAHTIRDQSAGMTIVFLQETAQPEATAPRPMAARTRTDGSSFNVEVE